MPFFQKKPVEIEARQFTSVNGEALERWINEESVDRNAVLTSAATELVIKTLEGQMVAKLNDWIIKGVAGEFYPCKPSIFEETYQEVAPF